LTSFDVELEDGTKEKRLRWCGGLVKEICDGTWLYPNARTRCYKENEVARIKWDAVEELGLPTCEGVQELPPNKWNRNCEGAWRKELGDESFGL
jgi:hypothetical protein